MAFSICNQFKVSRPNQELQPTVKTLRVSPATELSCYAPRSRFLKKFLYVILCLFAMPAIADYDVGQVWEYETRPGEESSLVYIVKVDEHEKLGKIFHISIVGIKIGNPAAEKGYVDSLPHAPVSEEALRASLTKLVRSAKILPDFAEGYAIWRQAFDSGEAGIFTVPVHEIVSFIEHAVNANGA